MNRIARSAKQKRRSTKSSLSAMRANSTKPKARSTVDVLADLYITKCRGTAPKSIDWIELVWRVHLKPFFGDFRASRINTEKILQYRAERLEAGAGLGTVNRELAVSEQCSTTALKITRRRRSPAFRSSPRNCGSPPLVKDFWLMRSTMLCRRAARIRGFAPHGDCLQLRLSEVRAARASR